MAITKTAVTVLTSASIAAGGTKTSPSSGGSGSTIDTTTYYGGEITWKITNGASAPGVAMTITIQASSNNGTSWFDYYSISGDTTSSSINSGSIALDRGVMYVRALAYGNTTNAVTAEVILHAVTAV